MRTARKWKMEKGICVSWASECCSLRLEEPLRFFDGSISCSYNFPNKVAKDIEERSLLSEIAVTLGCHSLLKHLKTLLIKSSLGKIFPKEARCLTICVNLFCMLWMFSLGFILNNSYSCVMVLTLDLFTSVVYSCVSWRVSHISLTFVLFDTLKYSSIPRAEVIMFWL